MRPPDSLAELLALQDGVVSRAQVHRLAEADHDVERRLRRREWARVHPGVYVEHTGPPTWRQRAWAAVLVHGEAWVADASALRLHHVRTGAADDDGPVSTVVDAERRVAAPAGVRTSRLADPTRWVHHGAGLPCMRLEPALLRVASATPTADACVAVLGDAVQDRRTTTARLLVDLDAMLRLPRRSLLREVLVDVAEGALSALERRYLRDVERAHGLPSADRQVRRRADRATTYRDVEHAASRVVVELDGSLAHRGTRWRDLERDAYAAADGWITVHAGWHEVLDPCRLARVVARLLQARGWTGVPRSCPRCMPRAA